MSLAGILSGALLIASTTSTARKSTPRTAEYPIEELFLKRQSKYALHRTLPEKEMRKKLNSLFTAFIWAPSSYNNQPGRIVYALHGTKAWDIFFDFLVPFNQSWAKNAGALLLIVSRTTFEKTGKPSDSHSFDTGAAVENLLLQATAMGLVGHAIGGFDDEKARTKLKIPKGYELEVMVAIGESAPEHCAEKSDLARDAKPSTRKKVKDFAFEGHFKN